MPPRLPVARIYGGDEMIRSVIRRLASESELARRKMERESAANHPFDSSLFCGVSREAQISNILGMVINYEARHEYGIAGWRITQADQLRHCGWHTFKITVFDMYDTAHSLSLRITEQKLEADRSPQVTLIKLLAEAIFPVSPRGQWPYDPDTLCDH